MSTACVLDVQICSSMLARNDPQPAIDVARRAADLARRYGLGETLAVALGFEATGHARARRREAMEDCLAEGRRHAAGNQDFDVVEAGARVFLALVDDAPLEALRYIEQSGNARYAGPFPGWWALLRTADGGGEDAVEEIRARGEPVHFFGVAYLRYAEAVVLGRAGHSVEALSSVATGDRLLESFEWFRHYAHRLIAPSALADGWADPVAWLREAQAFFDASGDDRVASTCRSLLRRAGVPVARRGRGTSEVPPELRSLGLTSREVDVLSLVAGGLSNREIAERLFLSPRTVEAHVERMLAKTGVSNRRELARIAARAGVVGPTN